MLKTTLLQYQLCSFEEETYKEKETDQKNSFYEMLRYILIENLQNLLLLLLAVLKKP